MLLRFLKGGRILKIAISIFLFTVSQNSLPHMTLKITTVSENMMDQGFVNMLSYKISQKPLFAFKDIFKTH